MRSVWSAAPGFSRSQGLAHGGMDMKGGENVSCERKCGEIRHGG